MKIALCISGHMRTFEQCFSSIKNSILDHFDIDVFIHTWDTSGTYSNKNLSDKIPEINKLFNPKKIQIETFRENNFKYIQDQINIPICGRSNIYGFAAMFYSIYTCNNLRKQYELDNNIKYDYIIRCRSDLFFYDKLLNIHLPEPNTIAGSFIPCQHLIVRHPANNIPRRLIQKEYPINDQFAIGDDYSMNIYCDTYHNLIKLSSHFVEFRPEIILLKQLELNSIKTFALPIYYGMLREDQMICILQ